jgi:uncharacterized protein YbjT (DUF2867 family)
MRTALLAGATGLVGGHLLEHLLADDTWDRVLSVGRRETATTHPKLEQRVVDLAALGELPPVDDAFCALGTTIKKAGSQAAFRKVDHDAVVALATAARQAGATSFLHVTSVGASARSRVFYSRVKGETERDVASVGLDRTTAFRPSIIDGHRGESRPGEQVGLAVMRTLGPVLGPFRPTHADDVARAMLAVARERDTPAPAVVSAGEIPRLAERLAGRH